MINRNLGFCNICSDAKGCEASATHARCDVLKEALYEAELHRNDWCGGPEYDDIIPYIWVH